MLTMREVRKNKLWNQAGLGSASGLSQTRISQIEREPGTAKMKEADVISKALGYPMGELFPQFAIFDPSCQGASVDKTEPRAGVVGTDNAVKLGPMEELQQNMDKLNLKIKSAMKCLDLLMLLIEKTCEVLEARKHAKEV
ncbi:MAG: helix-turn-helix transcriptional regulator [Syntrophaceae bacterium]